MLYDISMGEAAIRIELGFGNYFCPRGPWHIYRFLSSQLHLKHQPQGERRLGIGKINGSDQSVRPHFSLPGAPDLTRLS